MEGEGEVEDKKMGGEYVENQSLGSYGEGEGDGDGKKMGEEYGKEQTLGFDGQLLGNP